MNNDFNRLSKVLRNTELNGFKLIFQEMNNEENKIINVKNITKRIGKSKNYLDQIIHIMEIIGLVEIKTLGRGGTHVKIINKKLFKQLINLIE